MFVVCKQVLLDLRRSDFARVCQVFSSITAKTCSFNVIPRFLDIDYQRQFEPSMVDLMFSLTFLMFHSKKITFHDKRKFQVAPNVLSIQISLFLCVMSLLENLLSHRKQPFIIISLQRLFSFLFWYFNFLMFFAKYPIGLKLIAREIRQVKLRLCLYQMQTLNS